MERRRVAPRYCAGALNLKGRRIFGRLVSSRRVVSRRVARYAGASGIWRAVEPADGESITTVRKQSLPVVLLIRITLDFLHRGFSTSYV